jgi:hypothetical protein
LNLLGSLKDLEDIVTELRRDHPIIVKAKEERVEVHKKLTNLTVLLEKRLHNHKCKTSAVYFNFGFIHLFILWHIDEWKIISIIIFYCYWWGGTESLGICSSP